MGDLHFTPSPARHKPPPHTSLHTRVPHIPPYPSPPPMSLLCTSFPLKTLLHTRDTSFFPSAQELRRRVCGLHNSSCHQSTWSRSPLYPLTSPHCISRLIFPHCCGRHCLWDRTFFGSFCLCPGQPPKKVGLHVSLPCYHMSCLAPILTIPSALYTTLFACRNPLNCLPCT